jgi:hypothetical protein
MAPLEWARAHRRRLREMWRSAGWPCHDLIELDLLAGGLLSRHWDEQGRETLRVTDAGIELLVLTRRRNQAARTAHEDLVLRVAREMQNAGRVVWRGLSLRVAVDGEGGNPEWVMAMPDVFSIRHTTLEAHVEPVVHEIKVSRADLLTDLRRPAKGLAYQGLASQCWFVLRAGIATIDEIPPAYGVMFAHEGQLDVARAAPRRPMRASFSTWMALARATAEPAPEGLEQGCLGAGPGSD